MVDTVPFVPPAMSTVIQRFDKDPPLTSNVTILLCAQFQRSTIFPNYAHRFRQLPCVHMIP